MLAQCNRQGEACQEHTAAVVKGCVLLDFWSSVECAVSVADCVVGLVSARRAC